MCLYAGGMALNDVCDAAIDARERPNRPIPSGAISRGAGLVIALTLLGLGVGLAGLSGRWESAALGVGLVIAIVGYDALLKATLLGPFVMGTCRALSFLLGASHAHQLGGARVWVLAAALGLFVAGIVWISRSEVESAGRGKGPILIGLVAQVLALFAYLVVALNPRSFGAEFSAQPVLPLVGLLILALVLLCVVFASGKAWIDPLPGTVRRAVRRSVLCLPLIHAGIVASARGPLAAVPFLVIAAAAFLLARFLEVT